jgi:3,4-dihydroxy 2-butanone 4-phosphate synthase/GTP cyclohydrolase II
MSFDPQATAQLPTRFGAFKLQVFTDAEGTEHMAVIKGELADDCLVRVHSECATGDILGSLRCDCRDQLEMGLQRIEQAGQGLVIYLRKHEGRGIGLVNKIRAYALQEQGVDTLDANIRLGFLPDARNYGTAIGILKHYGLSRIKLLTNNRHKIESLEQAGITVTQQIPLWTAVNPHNEAYIQTKRTRMGHIN